MLDEKKSTLHFGALSLLPLKTALISAEKESPPRAPKRQLDVNEELALKLIAGMKKEYKKNHVIASLREAIPVTMQETLAPYASAGDCFAAEERRLAMT